MPNKPYRPSAYECALLLLHLRESWIAEKKASPRAGKAEPTRFRVSPVTLKRLACRPRIHDEFLVELQDWLLEVGWVLFFAGGSFGMVKVDVVENWTRLGSKRIALDLEEVASGDFDFAPLEKLVQFGATDNHD